MFKGKKEADKFREGKSLTRKQAILANCYICNGENEGGEDCLGGKNCPLYQYFPYNGLKKRAKGSFPALHSIVALPIVAIITALLIAVYPPFALGKDKPIAGGFEINRLADAIYIAEGGANTRHPYGILKKYKKTTPRQACINTIKHALRDHDGKSDFIEFLGSRYCPTQGKNLTNDEKRLNIYWVKNVKYFLKKEMSSGQK